MKILIIDDEETHVRFLTTLLAKRGDTQIEAVIDPRKSLRGYEEALPDLIILDLLMPGVGGMQVLSELRTAISPESYVPIIVVTSDLSPDVRREALASGANDFVVKPYDSSELLSRVGNLLEPRLLCRRLVAQNNALTFEAVRRREGERGLPREGREGSRDKASRVHPLPNALHHETGPPVERRPAPGRKLRSSRTVLLTAGATAIIAGLVLFGWSFGIETFKRLLP
ncbi:MAG: response regulator, partial [Verrucomicrobiota bacterium]|nr:response regulator [Verrucomicrobiota bacterium]